MSPVPHKSDDGSAALGQWCLLNLVMAVQQWAARFILHYVVASLEYLIFNLVVYIVCLVTLRDIFSTLYTVYYFNLGTIIALCCVYYVQDSTFCINLI